MALLPAGPLGRPVAAPEDAGASSSLGKRSVALATPPDANGGSTPSDKMRSVAWKAGHEASSLRKMRAPLRRKATAGPMVLIDGLAEVVQTVKRNIDRGLATETAFAANVRETIHRKTGVDVSLAVDTKLRRLRLLDLFIAVVILLNAVHIGWQAQCVLNALYDHCDSDRDLLFDRIFTCVYLVELAYRRVHCTSWRDFFTEHPDAGWHCFDSLIACFAGVSVFLMPVLDPESQASGASSAIRLIRIMRLARLIRLFKMFRQLTVMVMSLFDGLKTLAWAVILLFLCLYLLAILNIFLLGEHYSAGVGGEHFTSLEMQMYTFFECMTEGCSDTVVRGLVVETDNYYFYLFYFAFVVFTVFGVLNLFTAQFVENSMEAARVNEDRLRREQEGKRRHLADMLHEVLMELRKSGPEEDVPEDEEGDVPKDGFELLKDNFLAALRIPKVQRLFGDMDILNPEDMDGGAEELFDVLDADGSGTLTVAEIVDGVMRVQGAARSLDTVAVRLAVGAIQKDMRALHEDISRSETRLKETEEAQGRKLHEDVQRVEAMERSLQQGQQRLQEGQARLEGALQAQQAQVDGWMRAQAEALREVAEAVKRLEERRNRVQAGGRFPPPPPPC